MPKLHKGLRLPCSRLVPVLFVIISKACLCQQLVWAKDYPNNTFCVKPEKITVGSSGRIAVAGAFDVYGTHSDEHRGAFICALDAHGNLLWGDTLGGNRTNITGLAYDSQNFLVISGITKDTVILKHHVHTGTSFLIKYSPSGQIVSSDILISGSINDVAIDRSDRILALMTIKQSTDCFGKTYFCDGSSNLILLQLDGQSKSHLLVKAGKKCSGAEISLSVTGEILIYGMSPSTYDTLFVVDQQVRGIDFSRAFVIKSDSNGLLKSITFVNGGYYTHPEDFAGSKNGEFVTGGVILHHGASSRHEIYDINGDPLPEPICFNGQANCTGGAKLAFADTTGIWSFHAVGLSHGSKYDPDSTWTELRLEKIDRQYQLIIYERIPLPTRYTAIAGDGKGGVYISSALPPQNQVNLQNIYLRNNTWVNKLFVAKYIDNGNYLALKEKETSDLSLAVGSNPASETLHVRSPFLCSGYLFDASGKLALTFDLNIGETIVNVSELPRGAYILRAISASEIYNMKVLLR